MNKNNQQETYNFFLKVIMIVSVSILFIILVENLNSKSLEISDSLLGKINLAFPVSSMIIIGAFASIVKLYSKLASQTTKVLREQDTKLRKNTRYNRWMERAIDDSKDERIL